MTGYGRGESVQDGFKITVELGSVNRKQAEIAVTLPRELDTLEAQVRDAINAEVSRGRVTARVSLHTSAGKLAAKLHLNTALPLPTLKNLPSSPSNSSSPGRSRWIRSFVRRGFFRRTKIWRRRKISGRRSVRR